MSLSVVEFGRQLVETGDLDPIYVMLWKAKLERELLDRWTLAYLCFYHSGTCSWIVDQGKSNYWAAMLGAARSSLYPRGTERRHFRGELALKSVKWLAERGIESLYQPIRKPGILPLADVMRYVQTWVGFGPWVAFKAADFWERLGMARISFTNADTFLFDSPKEGARQVVARYANGEHVTEEESPAWAFAYLKQNLGSMLAPPRYERKLNGQEAETILCKVVGHWEGRYEVGHDIHEARAGLLRFPTCKTSQRLLKCL